MRDILFRGKRKDNGEWVEGELLHDMKNRPYIYWTTPKELPVYFLNKAIVIPETIGQYTGIADKKGKSIFEGDIVKMRSYGGKFHNAVVYFQNGKFAVDGSNYAFKDIKSVSVEVIGNIHDNPELLEVKQ